MPKVEQFFLFSNIFGLLYLLTVILVASILRFINENLAYRLVNTFISESLEKLIMGYIFLSTLIVASLLIIKGFWLLIASFLND